jgi:hypothetical protein
MREATDAEALAACLKRLGENDEEIKMLKESRAAAVSQEQTSRVECNRLRGENADLKRRWENQKTFIQAFASCLDGLPVNHIGGSLIDGARDAHSIRVIVEHLLGLLREVKEIHALRTDGNRDLLNRINAELGLPKE